MELILSVLLFLAMIAVVGLAPSWIVWLIWNNVVVSIWTSLPIIGFWQIFLILLAIEVISKLCRATVKIKEKD